MVSINKSDFYYEENLERQIKTLQKENSQLKDQLKQRDEVIDEIMKFLKAFHNYENRFKWCEQDYIDTIEKIEQILQRYRGDNK